MREGIAVFVAVALVACGVGFGSGVFVGRQFPAKHFERFGESRFLLNPSTGKICDPFKNPSAAANPIDQAIDGSGAAKNQDGFPIVKTPPSTTDPFAAYGGHEIKPAQSDYPPSCDK